MSYASSRLKILNYHLFYENVKALEWLAEKTYGISFNRKSWKHIQSLSIFLIFQGLVVIKGNFCLKWPNRAAFTACQLYGGVTVSSLKNCYFWQQSKVTYKPKKITGIFQNILWTNVSKSCNLTIKLAPSLKKVMTLEN